jgi:hypothetical protein
MLFPSVQTASGAKGMTARSPKQGLVVTLRNRAVRPSGRANCENRQFVTSGRDSKHHDFSRQAENEDFIAFSLAPHFHGVKVEALKGVILNIS